MKKYIAINKTVAFVFTACSCLCMSCGAYFLIGLPLLLCSCGIVNGYFTELEVRQDVVLKWQGKDTGIRDLLNIDGYFRDDSYVGDSLLKSSDENGSDDVWGRAFFDDGTFVVFSCSRQPMCDRISIFGSGVYTTVNDTLVMEEFVRFDYDERPSKGFFARFPVLRRFKIVDRNTMEYIDSYDLYANLYTNAKHEYTYGRYLKNRHEYDRLVLKFKEGYTFPTNDVKMKKKKWMWENADDWKRWKAHRKSLKGRKTSYKITYWD